MLTLRPFQRAFLRRALSPRVRTAALSLPRGNGKSSIVAWLASRVLTPGDSLFVPGAESHIAAASIGQARRTVFKLLREFVEALPNVKEYRIADTQNVAAIRHVPTNAMVSVIAANGKTAQGLVRAPWVFCDEPGAYEVIGGGLLNEAIQTALGKPGVRMKVVYLGTLAPSRAGWWVDMVRDGSHGSTHVTALMGDLKKWDHASEIRRVNPLMWAYPESRAVLLEERNKARNDSRARASFLSYRLNRPTADESSVLLTVDDWERTEARPVGDPAGRPIVGLDLGGGRAWSAAVALWRSGRVEAFAVAPGQPSVEDQERRDRVPAGTYRKLHDAGLVITDGSRRVPRVSFVMDRIRAWRPDVLVCDRFRYDELRDCNPNYPIVPRKLMPSEWSEDIRALRRMAADGPLSCEVASRSLVAASLAVSEVKTLDDGNVRLVKRGAQNAARDDVAAALTLAAGALARVPERSRGVYLGVA